MKARGVSIAILSATIFALYIPDGNTFAGEEGALRGLNPRVTAAIAVYSRYLWRGFTLDKDPVLQTGISAEFQGFKAGIAASMDMVNDDALHSDEVDYWLQYSKEFGGLSISLGHTYYDFPGSGGFSREFYLGIGTEMPLSPSLTYYHDYGKESSGGGKGDYFAVEIAHTFPVAQITINIAAHAGYNRRLFINGKGGDSSITLEADIPLALNAIFSPIMSYSITYGSLRSSNDGNQKDRFCGGVNLFYNL